jgi:hypothetical protein
MRSAVHHSWVLSNIDGASEPESFSGVPEQRAKRWPI